MLCTTMWVYLLPLNCTLIYWPPQKNQTLNKAEVSKIIYEKIKDLENIKKNRKQSVQNIQHLGIRKPERDIRKKKAEEKTIK